MVRRDGLRVRCFTRNGNNWADRFFPLWDGLNNAENFIFYHFIANRLSR
jgi:ATP-dependent DNA ligase